MKRELTCFILSIAIVLVVGYGVVAPRVSKKENTTTTTVTQKAEKPKSKKELQQEKVEYARTHYRDVENDWVREYDIYSLKDVNIKK